MSMLNHLHNALLELKAAREIAEREGSDHFAIGTPKLNTTAEFNAAPRVKDSDAIQKIEEQTADVCRQAQAFYQHLTSL